MTQDQKRHLQTVLVIGAAIAAMGLSVMSVAVFHSLFA